MEDEIKIEGGCFQVKGFSNTWRYTFTDVEGIHVIDFTAHSVPEVGDFIVGGTLVKREGIQVNPDTSKWNKPKRKVWGNG